MSYRTIEGDIAEIGIKICEVSQQNKGYGRNYLKMLLDFLFMSMKYKKIILDTNIKNTIAQHVYEKMGFQRTGIRFNSWKNQLGELQSSIDYEMTRTRYLSLFYKDPQ